MSGIPSKPRSPMLGLDDENSRRKVQNVRAVSPATGLACEWSARETPEAVAVVGCDDLDRVGRTFRGLKQAPWGKSVRLLPLNGFFYRSPRHDFMSGVSSRPLRPAAMPADCLRQHLFARFRGASAEVRFRDHQPSYYQGRPEVGMSADPFFVTLRRGHARLARRHRGPSMLVRYTLTGAFFPASRQRKPPSCSASHVAPSRRARVVRAWPPRDHRPADARTALVAAPQTRPLGGGQTAELD